MNFVDPKWLRPFVAHTRNFKGLKQLFFTRPTDRAGRKSTTLMEKKTNKEDIFENISKPDGGIAKMYKIEIIYLHL